MTNSIHTMNDSHLSLRIELAYIEPLIWRRVIVPTSITLPRLSEVMLASMGWHNYHLHEFTIDGVRYGVPDPDGFDVAMDPVDEVGVSLTEVLGEAREFSYLYDFGDDWKHRVVLEGSQAADLPPHASACVAGECACPPENVGGPPGYMSFLEALVDPANDMHLEYTHWIGSSFDTEAFDVSAANERVQGVGMYKGA